MDILVTQDDIIKGLRELGLEQGDIVFLHSSLSSFGYVDGGADTVVRAFLEVLGTEGTLSAPIFRNYFWDGPDQIWDRDNSPSLMGRISEAIRTWEGNYRSHHAPHPIAAIGKMADDLTDRHNITDFSFDSPFARLIELNAWIVLLGVDFNVCTMIHLIEERAEVPYRRWIDLSGTVINKGIPTRMTYRFFARYPCVENDFIRFGRRIEDEGFVKKTVIGKCIAKAVRSRDLYEKAMSLVRQDPLFFVSSETRDIAQKYVPKYGMILDDYADNLPLMKIPDNPISRRLAEILYVPNSITAPSVEIQNQLETKDGLILEQIRLRGGASDFIPGIIAIPQKYTEPLPAIICLHGTGENCEELMEEGFFKHRSTIVGWARELARRGFISLAITQFSHPPRHEPWNWELPKLLPIYGRTAMGLMVSDVIECFNYLSSRPEVDDQRIAVGGYSLGGIVAFYSFVIESRLASAFVFCGGVGSIRHLIRYGSTDFHSVYYYIPRIISEGLDHPNLLSAIAPRPLFIYGTTQDAGMPESGLREFEKSAQEVYKSLGAKDELKIIISDGRHDLSVDAFESAVNWLMEVL
ncbi:MAG: AAC(3) family N-acetyltransferase [bacterium]